MFFSLTDLLRFLLFLTVFSSCVLLKQRPGLSVSLKAEQTFEKDENFESLRIGGLSALAYDDKEGVFFALSDDKKDHRFYKLTLSKTLPYRMEVKEQIFLKEPGHKKLKRNMDPEALALYGAETMFIASEGQQIYKEHEPTQIFTFDRQGVLKEAWPVPPVFWQTDKHSPAFGQQENKGFESLALDKKSNLLWTATEQALKQDLIFKDKFFTRLSAFDIKSKKMLLQYPYLLRQKNSGLTALKLLDTKVFISLERAYKKQKRVNEVYLFFTDCRKASDIKSQMRLKRGFKACQKYPLWSSSDNPSLKVDNLEALALGPILPSKKQLIVLASDNNFNEERQKNQFLFFELSR